MAARGDPFSVRLTEEQVELIADKVASRLAMLLGELAPPRPLTDAAGLARYLNCSRDWVYRHATELGALRLRAGSHSRLAFDLTTVRKALTPSTHPDQDESAPVKRRSGGRPTVGQERAVELLPILGRTRGTLSARKGRRKDAA